MATEDEAREAADGTEVQVEAVDLGTVHLQAHPEVKLPSIMEIKNVGEITDSTEGTLKISEDQVLVEAPSEVELPPEHSLNGKASSLNGHLDKQEKISSEQPHENNKEDAELDGASAHQSNEINKEEVTDGLSHGESTTEDRSLLKHEKDEEPRDDQQDSEGVTVDDELVQEDTPKTDGSVEQTDDGQRDQNQEPEKANGDTQPVSIANDANAEEAEAPTALLTTAEPHLDDSTAVPETIDEKTETEEPVKEDGIVHPDHKESFPEDASSAEPAEDVVKLEDQQSQQADAMDADVVPKEVPKSDHVVEEPRDDQQDSEGVTVDDELAQEDTPKTDGSIEQTDDGQQDQNQEPEKANRDTQPASIANDANAEEAGTATGLLTTVEPHLDDSAAVPETTDEKTETGEPAKADDVVHPVHKESFTEDASISEPAEEVVKLEDQHSQQADGMDADVVPKEVPKSEHVDEPATDAHEVLNQESTEETDGDGPVNEKTEETTHHSSMAAPEETAPEHDTTTSEPPVNIQVQNQESLEEIEDAEAGDTEAAMQQSSVAYEEAIPEDQHNLGTTMDGDAVEEDTLEAVEQKEGSQQDQDLGPENATENAQPASMANIPDVEVVAEAPSGVQTPLEINLDNSDAIPGTADGNTETDESAKADGAISENTSIAEPTVEVVKVEDRQSQQADVMDADLVKEEVPKSENTEEPMTYAQEFLNQESAEETDGPVNEKTEETEYKSNMAVPEETMLEHDAQMRDLPVNNQVQNQESLEEIEDTEAEMQQSSVAFEETTTEPCSETQHVHHVEPEVINAPGDAKDEEVTNKSNTENAVQDNILQSGPPTDIQPDQELEQTESKSTGTYTMDVASGQIPAVVFNDLAEEGATATPPSEPQVTETEEELKDTEAQELTTPSKELSAEDDSTAHEPHNDDIQQSLEQDSIEVKVTVSTSEEDTVEDNVTAEEPTSDSQEVDNAESTEETKGNIDKNIAEASNVVIIDEAVEEQNVLRTEDIAETHMRELEPEETKNTEPVESEKASDQINAVLFNDLAQKDTPESEMQQTESATETETEAAPQESNACVSEELSPEDHMTESETNCHTQEVSSTESLEVTDGGKDLIDGGISGESNTVSTAESSQENNVPESEPTADIQPVQELEPEDVETKETSHEMNTTVFHTPTEEDNPATIELNESERELSHTEAENPHHSDAAQPEEQAPEEIESEPQVLEPESIEEINDTEATEPTNISQGNIISTSVESVPEEIATEYNTATEPNFDHQQLQDQEPTDFKETEADEPQVIVSSSTLITPEQLISEDNAAAKEPSSDTQAENPEPSEVTVGTENLKSNAALPEAADPEEHVETDPTTDTSPVQEPEPEEIKDAETAGTEDIMISSDLSTEKTDMETMGIEALPHDSHVETIKELTEDDTEPVLEQESVEDTKCTDTMEQPGEPHGSTSDEPTPTEENTTVTEPAFDSQVQNLASQEIKDSEDAKTDELSDLSSFPTPEETDQESNLPRTEPTPDVQQVQELGSTEETRDTEPMGTEDHQQHGVSTLEEPAVDSEPNVDDQQVHEDEVPEDKDNEAIEAEEVIQQSNIAIPDDETEERSELRSDPDSYVQPAQQVELSRDSENSQLVKAEETSGQVNAVTIEETHTEDSVESEIDPPVDIKQEHEQEPVEEIKGIDANVSEQFHISPVEAIEKSASEGNIASIEPTSDIKQENELEETKEINFTEAINDGEQTENATLEDPSPTDYETTSERHPAELNEETMGNETDSVMLVPGIKDEIQTSMEPKDNACDVTETVLTTQGSEDVADEDSVKSPDDDILETSNNIYQVKEEQKDGCEHNSTEMSGVQNEENIIHVQDRDISGGLLTKGGTEEASESLFESDPQGAQDDTKKDDNTEGGEQTSDLNRQPDDVALQLQTCEADALSTERQDEVVQKVDLDQQQKEDEEIESQKEEIQADEQKHEDKGGDFTMEPLVDPKDIENGATDRTEDTDACEAKQTETVITEVLKHEEAPHVSEESTPRSMDMETDIGKGTNEGTEEDADAKNDNEDEGESAEKDDMVAKDCTDEQDEITDEITNEELEPGLASSDQEASDPAPSTDGILENDLAAVTQNVESGEHSTEDKECTDKVNDDVHTIQASEEIADEINENKEIRNEDNDIHHDESQTKTEKEEAPQLLSDKPCDVDARINDTTTLGEEIIDDNASINPREIEEIGENKGLDSTSEPFVESSIQNKVEDEKLSMTEQNDVDIEEIADESSSDINQTKQHQEEINKDDVQQLEVEENSFDKIDETVSHEKTETSTTEVVTINDNVIDKASGDDVGPSDGSLKTFNDTEKDLDVSSVITASKEESVNENKEDHKLALPAHTTQNENTMEQAFCLEKTEREIPLSEKLLSTEPEENQIPTESNEEDLQDEDQISNEMNEEDMQDTEIGAQKEVEQDLPVSNFLMNLILGKMNGDANETSESEAEREQEETTEDDSCVLIPKQEEILGSLPTEDEVDGNLTLEQEKHDVKCSEETQEMAKEKSDDLELGTERSIHTDEELNKDTGDLEIPAYQGNSQDKISGELLSEETTSVSTKMQSRDIEISYLELDDKAVDTACQENAEASTKTENGSLDLTNTEASEEDTPGEEQTEPQHECLPGDKSADEVSEQMPLLTESGTIDAKDLSCDAEATQNLACAKEDELSESSIIEATSTPDIQLECEEVEKKEEEQHASTDTGKVSQEDEESSNDNLQKSTSSAVKSDEQAPQITEPVSDTEKISNHEKEISEGSTCMDEKENSNFSIKGVESFQTAVEIQADGSNMQTNQDKKDEVSDNKTAAELEKLGESDFQEHQETGTEQKSPKEDDEGDQQFLVEKEIMIKEQAVPGTVENHEQTMSVKSNEEQELLDSKVQERDLNVVSPREASEAEENFVDVTKPEFSTDEEQSPKADAEEKAYDEKIKEVEGTKNFTDGEAVKTEAPGATPKAHKKQNLLSGVGSKVKHQLAKVKKAIVGKPGRTKPESPKS